MIKKTILVSIIIFALGALFWRIFYDHRGAGAPVVIENAENNEPFVISGLLPLTTTQGKTDLIKIEFPKPGDTIQNPVEIKGEAPGNWFFEGVFPIKILDENVNEIGRGQAQAQSEWMNENFVPFKANINFNAPAGSSGGTIVLEKDNPSGLPQNDDSVYFNVLFR